MVRGAVLLALVAMLAACGSSSADSRPRSTSAACGPASARTIASSALARVYAVGGVVYGCSSRTGRSFALGNATLCIRGARVGPFAVAGPLAAYGAETCGVDTGSSTVVLRWLTDGAVLAETAATTNPLGVEAYASVTSVVLRRTGAFAWIAQGGSIIHRGAPDIEVHDRHALLDSGPSIGPRSLQLHGSLLTWRHGSVTRSATL